MTENDSYLTLHKYRVTVLADGEIQTISVFAAGKTQAGIAASKIAKQLLGAASIQIKRVRLVSS